MTVELITGKSGSLHVDSDDIGAYNAYTMGTGCYVLYGCECTMKNSNTAHIAPGELLVEGRFVRISDTGEDVTIGNGTQGNNQNNLICVHYTRSSSDIESMPLEVVSGTPTTGIAKDPTIPNTSILAGDPDVLHPLYRISTTGITVGTPVLLFDDFTSFSDFRDSVSRRTTITKSATVNVPSLGAATAKIDTGLPPSRMPTIAGWECGSWELTMYRCKLIEVSGQMQAHLSFYNPLGKQLSNSVTLFINCLP